MQLRYLSFTLLLLLMQPSAARCQSADLADGGSAASDSTAIAPRLDLTQPVTADNYDAFVTFARRNAPSEDAFVAVQRLAQVFIRKQDYTSAAEVFRRFAPLFGDDPRFATVLDLLDRVEDTLVVTNLGPHVNSHAIESSPVLSLDGRRLYFASMGRTGGYGGLDIWVSKLQPDGTWGEATNLGPTINTSSHELPYSLAPDGSSMVLFGNYAGGPGNGDLFESRWTGTGWGAPHPFPPPINSKYFEADGQITADGQAFFFVSDRPGGVGEYHEKDQVFHGDVWGNTDIYVCVKTDSGWSSPINLGPVVNTPFAERTPFLHPDGRTLYFSSDGHGGLGMLDVYKTVRLQEDSWTEWSEPVNLGRQINTADDDLDFTISTSGTMAYFSSSDRSDSYGGVDLYSIILPESARPDVVVSITGTVRDADGHPLQAAVHWQDLISGRELGTVQCDAKTGRFLIVLPRGRNYGYYAELDGYLPTSSNIDLRNADSLTTVNEEIAMTSIDRMLSSGSSFRLNNLFFQYDHDEILPESFAELDRLRHIMETNPGLRVEIDGYTDDVGSAAYNRELSQRRARSVVEYLAEHGIDRDRMKPVGYGESKPIAPNDTESGRAKNRRVEVRILSR